MAQQLILGSKLKLVSVGVINMNFKKLLEIHPKLSDLTLSRVQAIIS